MIGLPSEYGFSCEEELVDYVLGREGYEGKEFRPGQGDRKLQEEILRGLSPKCPSCLRDVQEFLESGAMRAEIDKDPSATVQSWKNSRESYQKDVDEVSVLTVAAYCREHDDVYLTYQTTVKE